MLGNVLKGAFQVLELVRLTNEKSMQANRHTAGISGPFFIQHVKLIDYYHCDKLSDDSTDDYWALALQRAMLA